MLVTSSAAQASPLLCGTESLGGQTRRWPNLKVAKERSGQHRNCSPRGERAGKQDQAGSTSRDGGRGRRSRLMTEESESGVALS